MRVTYKSKNGEEIVGYFSDNFLSRSEEKIAGYITIYKSVPIFGEYENEKLVSIDRTVRIDSDGNWFFTYNGEKFNFLDYVTPTPKEFCENITKKSSKYTSHTLSSILFKYGLDSIHVMHHVKKCNVIDFCGMVVKFESNSPFDKEEDFDWIEYKFIQTGYSDDPLDNYKLRLVPMNQEEAKIYPTIHTYTDDLIGLFSHCPDKYILKATV